MYLISYTQQLNCRAINVFLYLKSKNVFLYGSCGMVFAIPEDSMGPRHYTFSLSLINIYGVV